MSDGFGPKRADPGALPPAAPEPPPAKAPLVTRDRLRKGGIAALALALPVYLEITSAAVRSASLGGFLALALGSLALVTGGLRWREWKRAPHEGALATWSALSGALGMLLGGAWGHWLRADAEAVRRSDIVLAPGAREALEEQAYAAGSMAGQLALVALPGALLGLFWLLTVIGARRMDATSALREGRAAPRTGLVWLAFGTGGVATVVALVVALWAIWGGRGG